MSFEKGEPRLNSKKEDREAKSRMERSMVVSGTRRGHTTNTHLPQYSLLPAYENDWRLSSGADKVPRKMLVPLELQQKKVDSERNVFMSYSPAAAPSLLAVALSLHSTPCRHPESCMPTLGKKWQPWALSL